MNQEEGEVQVIIKEKVHEYPCTFLFYKYIKDKSYENIFSVYLLVIILIENVNPLLFLICKSEHP